jgi:hypothetical protein
MRQVHAATRTAEKRAEIAEGIEEKNTPSLHGYDNASDERADERAML